MLSLTERELIVKLHEAGKKQQEIAALIGCVQSAVNRWIQRSKVTDSLASRPRSGRPTKLKGKILERVKKKILTKIKCANTKYSSVSTKQLSVIIYQEIGETYSMRHVERIMHKLGFSLITPRPEHLRHDKEKVSAFRDEFKKNSCRNMWVMTSLLLMR